MNSTLLALRLLRREWRSGELTTLFFSLLIAVAAVLAVTLVTDRLGAAMDRGSAELMGGDLVLESTREPDPEVREIARDMEIETARVYNFQSVIFLGDEMLLSSIKAVDDSYPLLGKVEIGNSTTSAATAVDAGPPSGEAWVDARVLEQLNGKVGDSIYFGAIELTVSAILRFEPDQGSSLFQFAPRVMVNAADLEPAQVLGPGSRIDYVTLFAGDRSAEFRRVLEARLGIGDKLMDVDSADNRASQALTEASQYIRIASLLTIVLAAIAIALNARQYSRRQYDVGAMMRCLGARQREVLALYIKQLSLLTLCAFMAAAVIGWLAHWAILAALAPLLSADLPMAGISPWLAAGGSALLLMAGFALPPVLRLADTPPLRVLRREIAPPPLSVPLVYGMAGLSQLLLLFLLFDDIARVLLIVAGVLAVLLSAGAGSYLLLRRLKRARKGGGLVNRSIRNLAAHAATSTSQLLAFSITLMLLMVIVQLRSGLLDDWRLQLPENAPNYFAFNIFPDQVDSFTDMVAGAARLSPMYPVVRGRVAAIDGNEQLAKERIDGNWELSLTWNDQLPEDNTILQGRWPPRAGEVSMESGFAERLGISVGDTLTLDVTGTRFTATVSSIRSVVWESLSPNFYLMLSQEQLQNLPTTYLTAFFLPEGNGDLISRLSRQLPAMTLIDVNTILKRMNLVLGQVSITVELVMIFVLLGGFAVLFSTLQSTGAERLREGALMRAVGASRNYLRTAYLVEFGLIGFIAGIVAIIGAEIATAVIYSSAFNLSYRPDPLLWVVVPALSSLAVAFAGYLGSRRILAVSPVLLLDN